MNTDAYKKTRARALKYMEGLCPKCRHRGICDRYMDKKHAVALYTELDSEGNYWCRTCPQYSHGSDVSRKTFIPWEEYDAGHGRSGKVS